MTDTPSEQIVKKANKTATFTDAEGRAIVIKKLSPMDEYNLCKVAGKAQQNEGQFMMLMYVYHIDTIDGEKVHKATLLQLEALIQRMGESFNDLVINVIKLKADDIVDAQAAQDEIKNLLPAQTQ